MALTGPLYADQKSIFPDLPLTQPGAVIPFDSKTVPYWYNASSASRSVNYYWEEAVLTPLAWLEAELNSVMKKVRL